ncbi:MAG: diguanylate cyclase [bacterium]
MSDPLSSESFFQNFIKLKREVFELNKLFEVNNLINSTDSFYTLAEKFIKFIKLHYDPQGVAFFAPDGDKFKVLCDENLSDFCSFEFINKGEGIWQIIENGIPFLVIDEEEKNIYNQFFERNKLNDLHSMLWVPFVQEGEVIAILTLGRKNQSERYTEEDISFIKKASSQISSPLWKHKQHEARESQTTELQKTLHNISILYNIGQAMNFIDDLKKLLKIILGKAVQNIGAQKGSLMLYDATTEDLAVKVVYGIPDKEVEEKINEGIFECTRIKIGEGIAGNVFQSKRAIITNLGSDDPRFKQSTESKVDSILCIPLIVKEEVIGVINITNKQDGKFFNQDDLDFMGALANQAAIAINNAQLYELATTDGLTKLFIYRHFHYLLDNEIRRSNRYRHKVSLLMMDIDNFKNINDTYGHQVGDEVLRQTSQVILRTVRKIDMACRYGGEEFAIILPETAKESSRKIAERLRHHIEEIAVTTKDGSIVRPTISVGISSFPDDANTQEEIISKADKALYFAKRNGKNCVAEFNQDDCYIIQDVTAY